MGRYALEQRPSEVLLTAITAATYQELAHSPLPHINLYVNANETMLPPNKQMSEQHSVLQSHTSPNRSCLEASPTSEGAGRRSVQPGGIISQQPAMQVFGDAGSVNLALYPGALAVSDALTTRTATILPSDPAPLTTSAFTAQHADSLPPTTESDVNTATACLADSRVHKGCAYILIGQSLPLAPCRISSWIMGNDDMKYALKRTMSAVEDCLGERGCEAFYRAPDDWDDADASSDLQEHLL